MSKEQVPSLPPDEIERQLEKLRREQNSRKHRRPLEKEEQPSVHEELPEWGEGEEGK